MKIILLLFAVLTSPASAAAAGMDRSAGIPAGFSGEILEVKGYISSWTQDCAGTSCALPVPGERNRPVLMRIAMPSAPGEAFAARAAETFAPVPGGEILAEMSFYAVCPHGGASGACAGRYFQAQVSLSGTAAAFCAAALNVQDFTPFPVLMCAGTGADGRRFGITLHRQPL